MTLIYLIINMYKMKTESKTITKKSSKATVKNVKKWVSCDIHKTAVVEEGAKLGKGVKVGAFSYIGANVKIGEGTEIKQHVVIDGYTTIGKNNVIYPFVAIGEQPQDLKYKGEKSKVKIGDNNQIREHTTVHSGTACDNMITIIGSNNLLMVNAHIAHDCVIGNHCIIANNATFGGHVKVGNYAVVGGMTAIHQKVRIGKHSMIGGMSGVETDVIPYGVAVNKERASLEGINLVGLKRRDFTVEEMNSLRHFYKELFLDKNENLFATLEEIKDKYKNSKTVGDIIEFLMEDTERHICVKK